ncbi:MAG: hypothetical protein PHC52_13355 [Syntrophales bacterium]|nr:hypothetical protein [Syntrophales bacterium]
MIATDNPTLPFIMSVYAGPMPPPGTTLKMRRPSARSGINPPEQKFISPDIKRGETVKFASRAAASSFPFPEESFIRPFFLLATIIFF